MLLRDKTILFANTRELSPYRGGVERISCNLAEELMRRGYKIIFLAGFAVENSQGYADGVKKVFLPDEKQFDSDVNIRYMRKLIEDEKVSVIINQAGNIDEFNHLCIEAVQSLDAVRMISAIHIQPDYSFMELRDFRITRLEKSSYIKGIRRICLYPLRKCKLAKLERKKYHYILENSNEVVVLSESYRKVLCRNAGDASYKMFSKITAIGNFTSMEVNLQKAHKEKLVLWVGRMDFAHKRPDRMILIWDIIGRKYPEWRLDMLGEGECLEALKLYSKKKCIKNIYFHGNCDPTEFYERASILCMTSTIEGLPMVLLEGMAAGCVPIVYGSFAAAEDVITNGENGYIVEPFCKKEYVKIMEELMTNEQIRERITPDILSLPKVDDIVDKWEGIIMKG